MKSPFQPRLGKENPGEFTTRRLFLKRFIFTGLAAPFVTRGLLAQSPGNVLRHVSFGAAGMAGADLTSLTACDFVKLVAVAEVDLDRAAAVKKKFPDLKVYQDWRELLDKEKNNFDSANVSTPDHMHAPIAMSAMQLGKHVYCQKPLTHDLYEARQLTKFARGKKLVTQMGIQIHSEIAYRMAVKLVQDGVIGKIKEVHSWSSKKWGDLGAPPANADPVPPSLNWDSWLGIAAARPFVGKGYYHPSHWRKRLDFGTGTFGDMGCHIYDPVFEALDLTAPISLHSEGPKPDGFNWAINAKILYIFPATKYCEGKTVSVTWYDGNERPPKEIQELLKVEPGSGSSPAPAPTPVKKGAKRQAAPKVIGEFRQLPDQGSIFVGTKGVMLLPHIAKPEFYPEAQFKDFSYPQLEQRNHWRQFAEACRGNDKTSANFDYSGPLTETVLLGGVATRYPATTLEWNTAELKFTNMPEASRYIRRAYRKGWEVKDLS